MANQQQFDTVKVMVEGTINTGASGYTAAAVNTAYNNFITALQALVGAGGLNINNASYHSTVFPKMGDTITFPTNAGAN